MLVFVRPAIASMDLLVPDIVSLVACKVCNSQTLPPYQLCPNGHVGCPPCVKYLRACSCGDPFTENPHLFFDWTVMAMKLRCKYRLQVRSVGGNNSINHEVGSTIIVDDDSSYNGSEGGVSSESRGQEVVKRTKKMT